MTEADINARKNWRSWEDAFGTPYSHTQKCHNSLKPNKGHWYSNSPAEERNQMCNTAIVPTGERFRSNGQISH